MASTLTHFLHRDALSHLAGARSFARGAAYVADGRVGELIHDAGVITARVRGTRGYTVKLWVQQDRLDFSCTCPAAEAGFCKHAVAVGLAWLAGAAGRAPRGVDRKEKPVTLKDVCIWVESQSRETLTALVLEALREDDWLCRRLLLEVAKAAQPGINLATYRAAIEAAVEPDDFVGYRDVYEHTRGIDAVIDSVEQLLKDGHAAAVVKLAEFALGQVQASLRMIDDSDGHMGGILDRLQGLHLAACKKAKPDPVALAEQIFARELRSDFDIFSGAAQAYAGVLGKRGLARYRELAEAEWARVPPLGAGGRSSDAYPHRFRITQIMETLARQSGDLEALVEVMSRDLSYAYSYVQIAAVYRQAGYEERALAWVERGLAAFPEHTDLRLREFVADAYHRLGRHAEALELAWANFVDRPGLGTYRALKGYATQATAWPATRERALALLRETVAARRQGCWGADHSRLVEFYLWEEDGEAAWQEAQTGGCSEELWRQLAAGREKRHPADAVAVYQRLVEAAVARKNNQAYQDAVTLLGKVQGLMGLLGREADFSRYLASVRAAHKPKRNLMKLLAAQPWG